MLSALRLVLNYDFSFETNKAGVWSKGVRSIGGGEHCSAVCPLISAHVPPISAHFPGEHLPKQDSFHVFPLKI